MRVVFIKLMLGLLAIMVAMFLGLSAIVAYEYGLLDKVLGISKGKHARRAMQ